MKRPIAIASAALLFGLASPFALAQSGAKPDKKPAAKEPAQPPKEKSKENEAKGTLKVGDAAPALKIEKWVKGDSVNTFEKGKVYVVEFWATWCGPCVKGMPHLTALQKEYKDKGVTIIGVNIWEDRTGPYTADTLAKVEKFVKTSKDMGYTVAYDGAEKAMDKAYMKAAGADGIPNAFIVDKEGKIAYIGHPMGMDEALKKAVGATSEHKGADEKAAPPKEKPKGKG